MKKYINKISGTFILAATMWSCETLDLDKSRDPFNLTPDKADTEFIFNAIEENFVRQIEGDADYDTRDNFVSGGAQNGDGLSQFGVELTRMQALANTNADSYASAYLPTDGDDEWTNFYVGILSNIRTLNQLASAEGKTKHIAIAKFIEAYSLSCMVDFFGDVPYSEAATGSNLNPKLDAGKDLYAKSIQLLDEAIAEFQATTPSSLNPATELLYNNDFTKWVKAANTLKLKLYVQSRLVDPTAFTKFNAIIASGSYIQSSADDFIYRWGGTSASNPDNRHPRYGINYSTLGGSDYMSNWLMGTMNNLNDPRIRYYFYRQAEFTPGNGAPADEVVLSCSLLTAPAHYVAGGFSFCNLPNGYWGRDHGDNAGTPPDRFKRTTYGVYPAAGKFDDNDYAGLTAGSGGKGAGITPILLASWVDFWKAEMALAQGNAGTAKTEMLSGINKSIAKVVTFGSLDPDATSSFFPTSGAVTAFTTQIGSAWDATTTNAQKWNILAVQTFVASFGNGIETYNFYRRTGYPTSLQPNREANPGQFMRSLYYPASAVNNNRNISQKPNQTQRVFWDNNVTLIAN